MHRKIVQSRALQPAGRYKQGGGGQRGGSIDRRALQLLASTQFEERKRRVSPGLVDLEPGWQRVCLPVCAMLGSSLAERIRPDLVDSGFMSLQPKVGGPYSEEGVLARLHAGQGRAPVDSL